MRRDFSFAILSHHPTKNTTDEPFPSPGGGRSSMARTWFHACIFLVRSVRVVSVGETEDACMMPWPVGLLGRRPDPAGAARGTAERVPMRARTGHGHYYCSAMQCNATHGSERRPGRAVDRQIENERDGLEIRRKCNARRIVLHGNFRHASLVKQMSRQLGRQLVASRRRPLVYEH